MSFRKKLVWAAVGALWTLVASGPAMADDTELFVGSSSAQPQAKPNILLVIDNSGSMDTNVATQDVYDPATAYPGSCDASRVYWRSGTGSAPICTSDRWFNASALMCAAARTAFSTAGQFTDTMAMYNATYSKTSQRRWETFDQNQKDWLVECEADNGIDGDGNPATDVYPTNHVAAAADAWSTVQGGGGFSWNSRPANRTYTIYSGNYLNWAYGPTGIYRTRLDVVKSVASNLLDSVNGVNVGMMNFNYDQGGFVSYAMEDVATARGPLKAAINALTPYTWTPLSETLYEAAQYYFGRTVDYGNPASVAASRTLANSNVYKSPINYNCQKNYVVILTDGEPTMDSDADSKIKALADVNGDTFASLVGNSCDKETYPPGFSPSGGDCLDDLAEYLNKADLSSLPGQQNITTYTVGFTVDLPNLAQTAQRGGGEYYTANDTASLSDALTRIVTSILQQNTTFTAPTVSVNAFNRTQNLNDLYVSVFKPAVQDHWPGNLKKYHLRASDSQIVDANGNVAVDPVTGFFAKGSQSYWSAAADGPNVEAGGAANQLPTPTARNVYTYLGNSNLTVGSNRVVSTNSAITDAILNTGLAGDPTRAQVISFINGQDLTDTNQNNLTTDQRNQMGDPLHSQPVSVVYGPTVNDAVIYMATNDGFLHAVDPNTGVEKWAFIPPEFLGDQVQLYENPAIASKHYAIDGSLRVQMKADHNGVIDPGEKVYLYFGMRRGGDFYYALDITNPDSPQFMWKLGNAELTGVGQSWSAPVPTKMTIQGATQNADHMVLVIGGGYEPDQDNAAASTDTIGNSIYIVDSVYGTVLWRGSNSGATKNFAVTNKSMDYSFPADVKVVDFDGDGFADRMYAADMGGQIWRFDVYNGQSASNLITGGVIAQLGAAPNVGTATVADTRRFYYSPDVALVNNKDYNFIHIGIGSGQRPHPLGLLNQDRFYAVRDYRGLGKLTQAQYDAITPVTDADLVDVTTDPNASVPQGSPGWKLLLDDGGWQGEKVLAESRTFNNQVFFTTFRPSTTATTCEPQLGTNRLYVMSLFNGSPVTNLDNSTDPTQLTETDRYKEFKGSIASEVTFIFPSPETNTGCVGAQCTPPPVACVDLFCFPPGFANNPVRTYWNEEQLD
jgi:type IV pilus assembly protein PilY1